MKLASDGRGRGMAPLISLLHSSPLTLSLTAVTLFCSLNFPILLTSPSSYKTRLFFLLHRKFPGQPLPVSSFIAIPLNEKMREKRWKEEREREDWNRDERERRVRERKLLFVLLLHFQPISFFVKNNPLLLSLSLSLFNFLFPIFTLSQGWDLPPSSSPLIPHPSRRQVSLIHLLPSTHSSLSLTHFRFPSIAFSLWFSNFSLLVSFP